MQASPPLSPGAQPENFAEILHLAQIFSTCVECFGLIHPSKDHERSQTLQLAKLGIQQARLLAWGDNVGIAESSPENRRAVLDTPGTRVKIETALQSIIDRPAHVHRVTQFEKYGLKPPKRFTAATHPALDIARLEGFREKFEILNNERWEVRRGMSVTAHHWTVVDNAKFDTFIDLVKHSINELINLAGNEVQIDRAVKSDIKALGWHPVFDRIRAAHDSAKLRVIKEVCSNDYPEFAAATAVALQNIDKEWQDNYQDMLNRNRNQDSLGHDSHEAVDGQGSEIPGAADKMARKAAAAASAEAKKNERPSTGRKSSIFDVFKKKSWRKNSADLTPARPEAGRSHSYAPPPGENVLTPPETPEPERSKSVGHIEMSSAHLDPVGRATGDGTAEESSGRSSLDANMLSQTETYKSAGGGTNGVVLPVTSMISRHDQWKPDY